MPDVKWYSASTASTGISVASGSGTTNRLMKFDASDNAADALLSDDGSNVTLASGALILPDGTNANPTLVRSAGGAGMYLGAAGWKVSDGSSGLALIGTVNGTFETQSSGYFGFGNSQDADSWTVDAAIRRHASGSIRFTSTVNGVSPASVVIGSSSQPSTPASSYLFIEGVSGAGGTPTTSHLTAGSGVAVYTQQAHDAEATKFVIAYSLSGSMRYISIPLDGTTATWTHNATRP